MAKKQKEENTNTRDYANVIKDKEAILRQYLREKDYAVKARQTKINNWIKNEEAYNGVTQRTLLTRSSLHVPVVFEGVQNMSSKLGARPDVKFDTIPEGDENAEEIMAHVVREDLDSSNFDLAFEQSKIECGIYGRTVFQVIPGNDRNRVELVDSLAYLISPIARDTRSALYQGRQFIYKTMEQIYAEADDMEYDMEEVQKLRDNKVPNESQSDNSSEASAKNLRMANMGLSNTTQFGSKVAEITEWVTYIKKGKKAVLHHLTVANDLYLLRCIPSSQMGLKRPNFVSYGTYARGITFWVPGVADIYRDPNLAIDVNVNQQIDNNTYRNFGMMFVKSSSGLKQSSIVPRPLGITSVECGPDESIQDSIWKPEVPEISDAMQTVNVIKGFADAASGLSANLASASKGGKLSVTQQAKLNAEVDAKIVAMRANVKAACEELFQLMGDLTADIMTTPRKVKIFGYKSLTIEGVTKRNFKGVKLVAKAVLPDDSQQNKAIKQKAKMDLYQIFKDDPKIPGQLAMRRSLAKSFGIEPDELESWFRQEDQPAAGSNDVTAAPAAPQNAPGQSSPPPTDATPLLSATGKGAQINVPKAIK